MTNKFSDLLGSSKLLEGVSMPASKFPTLSTPDKRSRTERREDFEKELAAIDKDAILELESRILDISSYGDSSKDDFWDTKETVEKTLVKFLRTLDKFEDLNAEESRKIGLKEQELKLESKHDWANKTRLFFFRVLATILFISSLFVIGYVEHTYEWARLPMSKYIKAMPPNP
jgi:hypothetical protein